MAWTSVKEQGHLNSSGRDASGERTATRVFVATSDTATTPWAAETATDGVTTIPVLNALLGVGDLRRVKNVEAKPDPDSGRKVFVVTVTYSNKVNSTALAESPLDRDAEYEWSFDDGTETYFIDRGVTPLATVNSAGERFEELLERETGSLTCTITKNIAPASYNPATALLLKDAVNDASITVDGTVISAEQAKCKGWTCGPTQYENEVAYKVSKVVLQFRQTWRHIVEDRGYNEKDGSTGKLKPILTGDKNPKPVSSPWPLDGAGAKKANATDAPEELEFIPYYAETFGGVLPGVAV